MSCRITQCRVAPRLKVNERLADQILLAVSTCVLQNRRIPGCTQGSKFARFGRPVVAVSTHTHASVAAYVSSRLRPTIKGYEGFADQVLLRAYTCVLQKSGLRPGVERLAGLRRPTAAVSIHMCVAKQVHQIRVLQHTCVCSQQNLVGQPFVNLDPRCNSALSYSATHMFVPAAAGGRPNLCSR